MNKTNFKSSFPIVDTHCHVDLYEKPIEVVKSIEKNGVYTIAVTNTPSVFPHMCKLVESAGYIRPALGLHPELITERHSELPIMWKYFSDTRYIGEIGLDYLGDRSDREIQQQVFSEIIKKCAESGDKVLTVHSRRAEADVVEIIGNRFPGKVILHWYSGPLNIAKRAVEYGFYFSINPAMIKTKKFSSLLNVIPVERLLTESDGPFARILNRSVYPYDGEITLKGIAEVTKAPLSEVSEKVYRNFQELIGFKN